MRDRAITNTSLTRHDYRILPTIRYTPALYVGVVPYNSVCMSMFLSQQPFQIFDLLIVSKDKHIFKYPSFLRHPCRIIYEIRYMNWLDFNPVVRLCEAWSHPQSHDTVISICHIYQSQQLSCCQLDHCELSHCQFGHYDLSRCRLGRCRLGRCWLGHCRLGRCRLGRCRLGHCRLGHCTAAGKFDADMLSSTFSDDAYLCQPFYFEALCICLEAVEQNNPGLLTQISVDMVSVMYVTECSIYAVSIAQG